MHQPDIGPRKLEAVVRRMGIRLTATQHRLADNVLHHEVGRLTPRVGGNPNQFAGPPCHTRFLKELTLGGHRRRLARLHTTTREHGVVVTRTRPRQPPVLATDSAVARKLAPVVALHDQNLPTPDYKGNGTRWLSHVGSLADTTDRPCV